MNHKVRESLSALMDGESDELEVRRILKTLSDSPEEADTWRRYHLARSVLQRDHEMDPSMDLSAMVRARIEMEPHAAPALGDELAPRRATSFSFMSSAAIAAAVSLMVITGVQVYRGGSGTTASAPGSGAELASQNGAQSAGALQGAQSESPTLVDLPMFSGSNGAQSGIMQVGAQSPWFMAPEQSQPSRSDVQQAQVLQGYLNRHAEQASYHFGGSWMPMLPSAAQNSSELPSQR